MTTLNIPGNLIRWRFVLLAEAKLASSRVLRLCHVVFTYPSPRPVGGCKGEGILFCVSQYSSKMYTMLRGINQSKIIETEFQPVLERIREGISLFLPT